MKQAIVIMCVALVSVGGAVASTSADGKEGKKPAWTESKAERFVLKKATVPAGEGRVALAEELRQAVELYWQLALDATVANQDQDKVSVYVELAQRYGRAMVKVRDGLSIEVAECTGSGVVTAARFRSLRCKVVSESVEIPSAVLAGDGETPVEGEPRSIGPIDAVLDVRVTGSSSFSYKAL